MVDEMDYLRELSKINKELTDVKQLVSSSIDLQNRMMSCESSINSPQLNSDFVTGNLNDGEKFAVRLNLELARDCFSFGAFRSGLSYMHDANEEVVISRSKFGTLIKLMRTQLSKNESSLREESGSGWGFPRRRSSEQGG